MDTEALIDKILQGEAPEQALEGVIGRAGARMLLTVLLSMMSPSEQPSGGAKEAQAFLNQGGKKYSVTVKEV